MHVNYEKIAACFAHIKKAHFIVIMLMHFVLAKDGERETLVGTIAPNWALKTTDGKFEFLNNYVAPERLRLNLSSKSTCIFWPQAKPQHFNVPHGDSKLASSGSGPGSLEEGRVFPIP